MSNVDINVDRRTTDGRKIGRLYRTLLQAGAAKTEITLKYEIIRIRKKYGSPLFS